MIPLENLLGSHTLALLQSGGASDSGNRYNRLGAWIGENAPDLFQAAQDPANMILGGLGLATLAGTAISVRAAVPSLYYKAVRDLAEAEGAITWGYRQGGRFDHFAKIPIPGLWRDRTAGVQFIAPTAGGKTQGLLPVGLQDLEAGRDVLVIEISGDLGTEMERHARARGAEVLKVDPSDPDALAFNPIYAPSNQKAGQKAAAAMKAVATNHPHYSSMNQNLARFFTILARDYKRHQGRDPNEANLLEVRKFIQNFDLLRRTVGAYEAEDKQIYIEAPWLSEDAAEWIEQSYLRWRPDYRETTTSGFIAYLNNLLSAEAARECLCPQPGKEVLDLAHQVSDKAADPALPGETGRLIVMRFPVEVLDGEPAADTAYWALKTVIDTTRTGRSIHSSPLSIIQDELPTLIGDASEAALKDYQLWITNIRKFNVAVHLAYQGWALLPQILTGTLQSNGRNVLISGGMGGEDARHAQRMLGSDLEEEVSENEELGRPGRRRSRRVSIKENPRYSVGEIQKIPRGHWWLLRLHRGDYSDPIVIRMPMAKMPSEPSRAAGGHSDGYSEGHSGQSRGQGSPGGGRRNYAGQSGTPAETTAHTEDATPLDTGQDNPNSPHDHNEHEELNAALAAERIFGAGKPSLATLDREPAESEIRPARYALPGTSNAIRTEPSGEPGDEFSNEPGDGVTQEDTTHLLVDQKGGD